MIQILDFYMDNCSPCAVLKPILKQFDNVEFINASEDFEKALKYNIRKAPTVVFIKNGEELKRFVGVKTREEISEIIDTLL